MIDLYYYTSPNARKVLMALEEMGLPYQVQWIDISAGDQHAAPYGQVNPNRKIPALIDHNGPGGKPVVLFESGACLLYLAEKTGQLIPADPIKRWDVIKWLFWQTSSQGPLLGQAAHFVSHAAKRGIADDYAVKRYSNEAVRLYGVMESHLAAQAATGQAYMAGEFSIADIAAFPWVRVAKGQGVPIKDFPHVKQWCERIAARPSALKKLERDEANKLAAKTNYYDDKTWEVLFGNKAGSASVGKSNVSAVTS